MTTLPYSTLQLVSIKVDKRFPGYSTGLMDDDKALEEAITENRRQLEAAEAAGEAATKLAGMAMSNLHQPYLVQTLSVEHPTILAQTAAAIAKAVLVSCGYDPVSGISSQAEGERRYCHRTDLGAHRIIHPVHDGRLTCSTVVGALLMSTQPLI